MHRISVLICALLFLLAPFQSDARDNPFVSKKTSAREVRLPPIASGFFGKVVLWQDRLNSKLTEQVKQLKDNQSWTALLPLMLVSFIYGVIHAAGPGHGKVVVFSYFMSRRSSIRKGLILGNLISLFHAVSGIVIVLALYFVIKTAYMSSFEAISAKIKLVSYGLIVMIGLMIFINAFFNITERLKISNKREGEGVSSEYESLLPVALAVGMVPCPGVVIIMLFTLSFDLLITGMMMSFVMALGMAATISMAGLLSIMGQEGILKVISRNEKAQFLIQKGLTVLGSLLLMAFGLLLLSGSV